MSALHDAFYDVLNGADALRGLVHELTGHRDGDPLRAPDRNRMVFILSMMAERADACARSWIDDYETRDKGKPAA